MYINLSINPYTVKQDKKCFSDIGRGELFNTLTIGKDSYIVNAVVETGLNLDDNIFEDYGIYNLQIGKYTSIAENVLFMIDINHDYLSLTQGCISEFSKLKSKRRLKHKGEIIIENDVWIGHGATIMNGCTVHNGAVIASDAVVTKDVPPYAIVGGNPAKVIKYRFSQEIIEKLLKISWWNWSSEKLLAAHDDMIDDVEKFAEKYYAEINQNENIALCDEIDTGYNNFLFVPDFSDKYPLHRRVIKEFCEKFENTNSQLIIYLETNEEKIYDNYNEIQEILKCYEDYNVFIQIVASISYSIESVMPKVNNYITNRTLSNIYMMELAEKTNVKIISGVDLPIFD
ncbi:MAG: CatB-related O-acetyltransferase [Oscillospiraceae bacterium]